MRKIIYFLAVVYLAAGLTSCNKDFLDRQPLDQISEAVVWQDPKLVQMYVYNIYADMPNGFRFGGWDSQYLDDWQNTLPGAICDEAEYHNSSQWSQLFNKGQYNANDCRLNHIWSKSFANIRKCNLILEKIGQVPSDETFKKYAKGEAFFMRALFYQHLLKWYGGVPIIKNAQTLTDDLAVPRATYDQTVDFIAADCDSAANLLPVESNSTASRPNWGRATKGAAMAIKSRVLLYAASPLNNPSNDLAKWQKAADAAKAIIDSKVYSLYPDYYGLFYTRFYDECKEIIFACLYNTSTRAHYWDSRNFPAKWNGWGGCYVNWRHIEAYDMKNGLPITDPASGYTLNDPFKDRDPRMSANIIYNESFFRDRNFEPWMGGDKPGGGKYANGKDYFGGGHPTATGCMVKKFLNQNAPSNWLSQTSWLMFRYAEILLNYAEAVNELGQPNEAATYIKMLRSRAGITNPGAYVDGLNQADMRERIRKERQVELAFEDFRYFDVRRWKIANVTENIPLKGIFVTKVGENIVNGQTVNQFTYQVVDVEPRVFDNTRHYWLPIPQNEMDKNPKLVQNPNW